MKNIIYRLYKVFIVLGLVSSMAFSEGSDQNNPFGALGQLLQGMGQQQQSKTTQALQQLKQELAKQTEDVRKTTEKDVEKTQEDFAKITKDQADAIEKNTQNMDEYQKNLEEKNATQIANMQKAYEDKKKERDDTSAENTKDVVEQIQANGEQQIKLMQQYQDSIKEANKSYYSTNPYQAAKNPLDNSWDARQPASLGNTPPSLDGGSAQVSESNTNH